MSVNYCFDSMEFFLHNKKLTVLYHFDTNAYKISSVNAIGIPTSAYQVLHLLSCTGVGGGVPGTPCLAEGYPRIPLSVWTWPGTSPPGWTWLRYPPPPHSWTWLGYSPPGWTWLRYPPWLDLARKPPLLPAEPGWGTPPRLDLAGVPPPPRTRCGLTK